jgi:hypothetical protein
VSPSTWAELGIGEAVARLAVARGGLIDDTTSEVYLDCLADLDPDAVGRACEDLAIEPRGAYEAVLPPVATIRARVEALAQRAALEAAAKRVLPMPQTEDDEPRYFCLACRDEPHGWRIFWCPGSGALRTMARPDRAQGSMVECGRPVHAPHSYAHRCECADTNPVIAKARERMRRRTA